MPFTISMQNGMGAHENMKPCNIRPVVTGIADSVKLFWRMPMDRLWIMWKNCISRNNGFRCPSSA